MKTTIWLAVIACGIVWLCMIFYMLYWGKQIKNLANKYNELSSLIEKIKDDKINWFFNSKGKPMAGGRAGGNI